MAYDTVIVRYGEIFLKSDYVRKRFEDMLIGNISKRLRADGLEAKIHRKRCRIYLQTKEADQVAESLRTVFGIVSVSSAVKTKADMDEMLNAALAVARDVINEGDSFAVRAERSGRHSFTSRDVEALAGERICRDLGAKVDLSDPDKTIHIEIRDESAYVFDRKIKAVGGMPYRSQKGLVALLSTGIDSPVACWMMMRRGCSMALLHIGPHEEVLAVVERLEELCGEGLRLYSLDYGKTLRKISEHAGRHTCIVCKRFMHRMAAEVAQIEGAYGIVTGENVGQVASQTLENLALIECGRVPVYRPLVALDKEEIIEMARDIGTFGLSKAERCPFVPDKPATKGDLDSIEKIEGEMDMDKIIKDAKEGLVLRKG